MNNEIKLILEAVKKGDQIGGPYELSKITPLTFFLIHFVFKIFDYNKYFTLLNDKLLLQD